MDRIFRLLLVDDEPHVTGALSLQLEAREDLDVYVSNSAAGALDVLEGYGHVCCFLDNDGAGRKATEEIRRRCESVTDKAVHYLPHKDLNEFLQHRLKKTEETHAELKRESG